MKLTQRIASSLVDVNYTSLPEAARKAAKLGILDTFGVMVPPSSLDETCEGLSELVGQEAGTGNSTLIGVGAKGSAVMAAFLNGSFVHVLDYDDTIDEIAHHPSAQSVPAAFAVAEKIGGVSGKDLITAVAVGSDLGARLSAAPKGKLGRDHQWFPISNFGVFSATAAAAKILNLNQEQMINAIGLALHRCHGQLGAVTAPESELRAIRDGFINKEGVLCALMAQKGVKVCNDAIERFYESYYSNDFDPDALTSGLGEHFRGVEASLKPWPSCRVNHGYIEATLAIQSEQHIPVENIQEIICDVSPGTRRLLCEPQEIKRAPVLSIQAKFSLYYSVALAALKTPEISDFLPQNLRKPELLSLAQRVTYRENDEMKRLQSTIAPAMVELRTHDGQSFSRRIDEVYGHPNNPMSEEAVIAKFKDCLQYAKNPISEHQVDRLGNRLMHLEDISDIYEISDLLP